MRAESSLRRLEPAVFLRQDGGVMAFVLVTGGAGFIGSHLVDALLEGGHRVRVLDVFSPQVHGGRPRQLPADVEVVHGDVRDAEALGHALAGVEVVFHKAADVGVGQSMTEIARYVSNNSYGTAVLLQAVSERRGQIRKLIVPSSVSIYGEGLYQCAECGPQAPRPRPREQLAGGDWELRCPRCAASMAPLPTPESKPLDPASVYAITKQDQEQLCLVMGRALGVPTVALRYFNVYGPRQALSNPYTGVASIFARSLLKDQPPRVFEDGMQTRDFTHVRDVVRVNLLAMERDAADYRALNVAAGQGVPVRRLAELLANGLGKEIPPELPGIYREGDVRHSTADISLARMLLGFEPGVALQDGVKDLIAWAENEAAVS
jgi:dTDP-L-rhamnose 4-epimerase